MSETKDLSHVAEWLSRQTPQSIMALFRPPRHYAVREGEPEPVFELKPLMMRQPFTERLPQGLPSPDHWSDTKIAFRSRADFDRAIEIAKQRPDEFRGTTFTVPFQGGETRFVCP
jgi:hypothetical protein